MNLKKFLKPDWKKIVIFLLLFFFIGLNKRSGACLYSEKGALVYCDNMVGLPLGFNLITDYSTPIDFPLLFTDIVFWYLISCLIIWLYSKFINRK